MLPELTEEHREYSNYDIRSEQLTQKQGGRSLGIAKWLPSKEERHQGDQMGCGGEKAGFHFPPCLLMDSTRTHFVFSILLSLFFFLPFVFQSWESYFFSKPQFFDFCVFGISSFQMDSRVGLICLLLVGWPLSSRAPQSSPSCVAARTRASVPSVPKQRRL